MSAPPHPAPTPAASAPAGVSASVVATKQSGRKLSFDVLRVVFVLLVVLYHGTFIGPLVYGEIVPRNYVFAHQVGASLLLVLSAYFVAATVRKHGQREGSARWWWGKFARLLPGFVVATVAAFLALRLFAPTDWYQPTKHDLVANLLMLWQWNGLWRWEYVDGSYWTIPLQLMAFTVAALIWRTRIGSGRGLRVLMWFALLAPLAQWWLRKHMSGTLYATLADGFGLHRWHLFVAGIAIWMFATKRIGRLHVTALLAVAIVAHTLHNDYSPDPDGFAVDRYAVLGVALGMLALLAAAVGPDWARAIPRRLHAPISWLAGVSYGVFLVHQTLGYVFMWHLQQLGVGPTLQTIALLFAATGAGWLLTRLVEQPTHRRLLALWDRAFRRGQATSEPATATPGASSSRS